MTKEEEEKFLRENFKAGEYGVMQIFVRLEDVNKLLAALKETGIALAVVPSAQAKLDFSTNESNGTEH